MSRYYYELTQAWASLKKNPGFVFSVVITMGVTLGAFICVTTLAYELLIKPLPYPDADRLYRVEQIQIRDSGDIDNRSFSYAGLIAFYKQQTVFSQAALIEYSEGVIASLPSQPLMELGYVTPEWFSLLDVNMHLGRAFEETEGVDSRIPVAILSYETWLKYFDADPKILSKTFGMGGISFRVVGVVCQNYVEPEIHQNGRKTRIWLPWNLSPNKVLRNNWERLGRFFAVGKLKREMSVQQAENKITPSANQLWTDHVAGISAYKDWHIEMELHSFKYFILGDIEATIYQFIFAMLALVILAVANVSNLYMARTAEGYRQLSLRAALGATKSQLFKNLFVEANLLLFMSTFLAMIIAIIGFYLLQNNLASLFPRIQFLSLNLSSLLVAVISVFLLSFLFAKLSSRLINYRALNCTLQSSGKGTGIQVSKTIRQILIGSQIAIATSLVFININLHKTAADTINEPMGFEVENIHSLHLTYSGEQWPSTDALISLMDEFESKLLTLPPIESIARSTAPYFGFGEWLITEVASNENYTVNGKKVNDQYFQMIEQPLIEGDYFTQSDVRDANSVAIVNQAFAKLISPDGTALGMRFKFGSSDEFKIIGVVKAANIPGRTQLPISVYVPTSLARTSFTIKTKLSQQLTRAQIVAVLKEVDPSFSVYLFSAIKDSHKQWLSSQIVTSYTTAALTIISLFLAAIGLYGILSYDFRIRRFEFGIRLAIGAKGKDIISLVFKDNLQPLIAGVIFSVVILLLGYLVYSDQLSKYIKIELIWMFAVTLLFIVSILLFACYFPLRRIINRPVGYSLRGTD